MLYIVNRLLNVAADNNHFFYLYKKLHLIYCIRARLRTKVFSTGHQRNDYIATWINDTNDHIFCNFTLSNENIDLFYPSYSHSLVVKYVECQLVITICLSKTITGKPLIKSQENYLEKLIGLPYIFLLPRFSFRYMKQINIDTSDYLFNETNMSQTYHLMSRILKGKNLAH